MGSLVSTSELSTYLGRTFTTAEAARAGMFLDITSADIRSRCGQEFTPGTSTVLLTAPVGEWLDLPQRPVTAVTAAQVAGDVVTDFVLHGNRVYRALGWWSPVGAGIPGTVTVSYSHGYAVLPDNVRGAVLAVVEAMLDNSAGYSSERLGDYSYNRGPESTDQVLLNAVIRRYRRPILSAPIVSA